MNMIERQSDIVIIGAGLTGLAIAYYLKDKNLDVTLIEARSRVGGRILTTNLKEKPNIELGATWLGRKHTELTKLLEELDIGVFEQILGKTAIYEPISTSPSQIVDLPHNQDPSFRIKGGSETLINKLNESTKQGHLIHDEVKSIKSTENGAEVIANNHTIKCKKVISTLPPYLFQYTIQTEPTLPADLLNLSKQTHTWMGESIKVALVYEQAFWRTDRLSGTIFSNVGPIPEMYDHSNVEDSHYALKGFLNGSYYSITKEERLERVLTQLQKYFGDQVRSYKSYHEKVWTLETHTSRPYQSHILPHQNNGHQIFRKGYLENRLYIAGSETSEQFPGYMEGAIRSAQFICEQLGL